MVANMIDFNVTVDDRAVRLRFKELPDRVLSRLQTAVASLSEQLRSHIVNDLLNGQLLKRRSGRLGRSIQWKLDKTSTSVTGAVFPSKDVPYAGIQEFGGKTAAHVIEARNGGALAFMWNGKQVFFKKVNHPGSNIPAKYYMRTGLSDMRQKIIATLQESVNEVVG
jgi:phage gpG-like protein